MPNHYKIVRIAGLSSKAAMELFYRKHPHLKTAPYAKQQQALFDQAYMYSDTFSKEMRSLGHSAEEIIYDLKPLQKRWSLEKGLRFDEENWQINTVISQLADIKPDIVYFQDIYSLPYEIKASLKQRIPSIKKIVIFRGFPGSDPRLFKELALADLLLLGSPVLLEKCRSLGLNPHLVYHSFDPSILEKLQKAQPTYNLTFIGSSGYGYEAHRDRYQMLLQLLQQTQIELWIDEPNEKRSWKEEVRSSVAKTLRMCLNRCSLNFLKTLNNYVPGPSRVKKLIYEEIERKELELPKIDLNLSPFKKPLFELFPNRCNPPLYGLEMFQMLQNSKIVLNKHSMPAQGTVDNIRLFQATGVGTCLLTDTGSNMSELFEADREIVTYSTLDECIEKANYLQEHEEVRRQIAEAGQKRTLKNHNSALRHQQINDLLTTF